MRGKKVVVGVEDRFGLADRLPEGLVDLPHFAADDLDPARSDGDIVVQACADDPQVAVHAIRNLARIGFGKTRVRWSQLGFGRTSTTSVDQYGATLARWLGGHMNRHEAHTSWWKKVVIEADDGPQDAVGPV